MSKITVKNISSATVVLSVPEISFNRSLAPGRVVPITQEDYDNLVFDPGVQNMIRGGYIKFEGLEEGTELEVNEAGIKEKGEIEKMLISRDIAAFAKFIPTASPAAKETIVQCAVENNITDNAFTALIKKYCGIDVINSISIKHQAEEK
jgi:hypothetical protein